MRFKTFLEAKAEGSPEQVFEPIGDLDDFLKKNCSDSLWMIEKNKPFFRGFKNFAHNKKPAFVDLTKTARKSQNTSNWYTEIFDNHPEMKDFPKRSKSLICTTNQTIAAGYGRGTVTAIIPIDGSKIGLVGSNDMWDIHVKLFGTPRDLAIGNDLLDYLVSSAYGFSERASFETLARLDKDLKDGENEAVKKLINSIDTGSFINYPLKDIIKRQDFTKDFLNSLLKSYSPLETGLTSESTTTLGITELSSQEVWLDKGAVVINIDYWDKLVKNYV